VLTRSTHCVSVCVHTAEFTDIRNAYAKAVSDMAVCAKEETIRDREKARRSGALDAPLELDAFVSIMAHREEVMAIAESVHLL